jgi:hypothetical protein
VVTIRDDVVTTILSGGALTIQHELSGAVQQLRAVLPSRKVGDLFCVRHYKSREDLVKDEMRNS